MKSLNIQGTIVLEKNYKTKTRVVVNQGGTRSSKTYSLAQLFILKGLEETGKVFTICRKTLPSLKATAMKDFFTILNAMGLYSENNHNKSDFTYKLNGNEFEFISVDQPQKIRGRKRNHLWLNEANEFYYEDFQQLILRTTEQIFLDYNPSDEFHWIYENVLIREDCTFIQSTYKDNPFISDETIKEIERLKQIDENYWRVYGLGQRGVSQMTIFRSFDIINDIPENAKLIGIGLDFGFTADPTAVIEVYRHDVILYLNEILYRTSLTNQDIADKFTEFGIQRTTEIIADSAEPKSIEEIYRLGFNIKPSKKGADSVNNGIDIMKRYQLKVTSHSINLLKELRNYKWMVDKNNKILNKPVDAFNHCLDAIRYLCLNKLNVNRSGKYFIH